MFNQITSRLSTLSNKLRDNGCAQVNQNAVKWLAGTACEWTLSSFIDDQMARDKEYYQVREEKRAQLAVVMAFCMDQGLTAQAILGDHDEDLENGIINETIKKEMNRSFKEKSVSEEHMQLLIDCGEDEEVILAMQKAENIKAERIANKRKNVFTERQSELRRLMTSWFTSVYHASVDLDHLPAYMLKQVISKFDYAIEGQRKYSFRGITMGNYGEAGNLELMNRLRKEGHIAWCLDRLEELERQSDFDDSGVIERGKIGDDERVDITY